jgi:adenylosuccinate lyase
MQDLVSDLEELDFVMGSLRFLGCRGTTGTEASFLDLFDGDSGKIDQMNEILAEEFGFASCFPVCGQTYPRKTDSRILNALSSIAQSCYRMAQDIRLLQHDRQLEEPFEDSQIGSSAMAYKRNPMRCERICSLCRYLMTEAMNAPLTASAQWLERTLDDSANRRLSMPEAFLCADAVLHLAGNVCSGLRVNEKIIERSVREYLPFIATENLLMEGVKRGGDRQLLHEVIRRCSMESVAVMREGLPCDLLSRLARQFHTRLTATSRQNRILRVIEGQDEYIRRFSAMAIRQESRRSAAHEEHHRLVDLVEQKDLPAFEALMRQHIERSKECCLVALAAQKQNRDL